MQIEPLFGVDSEVAHAGRAGDPQVIPMRLGDVDKPVAELGTYLGDHQRTVDGDELLQCRQARRHRTGIEKLRSGIERIARRMFESFDTRERRYRMAVGVGLAETHDVGLESVLDV